MFKVRMLFMALMVVVATMTGAGAFSHVLGATAKIEVIHSYDKYFPGKSYPIAFKIKILKGFYIHGATEKPGEMIVPTKLSFNKGQGIFIENVTYPEPGELKLDYADERLEVYKGEIIVRAVLHIENDTDPGTYELTGVLSYQACTKVSCLPPEKVPVKVSLPVANRWAVQRPINAAYFPQFQASKGQSPVGINGIRFHGALWLTLLGVFLGGLALNLTPCIYPLIPITVSYFGARSENIRGKRFIHGALYIGGLSITNSVLGVSAALTGGMLGSALQNPMVLIVVSGVIFAMGLSFFGFWELKLPGGLVNAASKGFGGFFGSFFMGLTLGVVAAPCLGPFVLGLLTYVGQKGDPLLGFLYFFVLSIGLGLPLALLAVCSGIVDKLPMSGNWLLWVKKCFGWILIGMAVFMIRPLIPGATWKILAIPVVLVAAGLHIAFLDKTKVGSVRFGIVKTLAGLGLFVVAFALASMVWRAEEGIKWLPYRQGLLQQAKAEKKPVIIDFYAEWCGPCREMDRITFRDARVKGFAKNFVTLRVDLTRERPETKELVKQFNIRGVPSVIFIDRGGNEVRSIRVESYEPPETFAIKMADILKK